LEFCTRSQDISLSSGLNIFAIKTIKVAKVNNRPGFSIIFQGFDYIILQKKAIQTLQNQSGQIHIEACDPNRPLIGSVNKRSANEKMKRRLEERVAANRKDLSKCDKENTKSVKKGKNKVFSDVAFELVNEYSLPLILRITFVSVFAKLSEKEFKKILKATSTHQHELDLVSLIFISFDSLSQCRNLNLMNQNFKCQFVSEM